MAGEIEKKVQGEDYSEIFFGWTDFPFNTCVLFDYRWPGVNYFTPAQLNCNFQPEVQGAA